MEELRTKPQEIMSTVSQRFVNTIQTQFAAEIGEPLAFTPYEKTLAQHLFLSINSNLEAMEAKRQTGGGSAAPFTWANVNMRKLSIDAVHRVRLGLDALIPGHVYSIPYFNGKEKKYDIDLRIGYVGESYYSCENALHIPQDVRYELVYSTDVFKAIMKDGVNNIESYQFEITSPFERGEVVGGFGYIQHDDATRNKLVIVTRTDLDKSRKLAKGDTFWANHPIEMMYKTIVHRVIKKIQLDPRKINAASLAYTQAQDTAIQETPQIETIDIPYQPEPEPQIQVDTDGVVEVDMSAHAAMNANIPSFDEAISGS